MAVNRALTNIGDIGAKGLGRIRERFHCTYTILQDYRRIRGYYEDAQRDTCAPSLSTNILEMRGINVEFTIISII